MILLFTVVLTLLIGIIVWKCLQSSNNDSKKVSVHGYVEENYHTVRETFRATLGKEREGLALAVYHNNRLVVDLWGGFADSNADRLWEKETLTCIFSATKALGMLVIAKLVSDGFLDYKERVSKYWPEFRKFGKELLTVEDLVNHKAGLINFGKPISFEEAEDLNVMSKMIEQAKPHWTPGSGVGYHALTIGFLLDQLVRRVDTTKRTVAQFHREEILSSHDSNEFFIGLPKDKFHLAARITNPSPLQSALSVIKKPMLFVMFLYFKLTGKLKVFDACNINAIPCLSISNIILQTKVTYNDPKNVGMANIASTGMATARGLANVFLDFFKDGVLSTEISNKILQPTEYSADILFGMKWNRGHGFNYLPHPINEGKWLLTGMGHGGQFVEIDVENNVVIAMIRNGLGGDFDRELEEYSSIRTQILKIALHKK